ncbi:MAG: hypothetical protein WD597_05795, partial [Balneolaceae bacterium]
MSINQCDFCGEQKDVFETYCDRCGRKDQSTYTIKNILVVFGLFLLVVTLVPASTDPEPDSMYQSPTEKVEGEPVHFSEKDNKSMAYYMCEQWVKQRLKSPKTADFPSVFEGKFDNIFKDGAEYQIWSYVDSENSFGATLRTGFTCIT